VPSAAPGGWPVPRRLHGAFELRMLEGSLLAKDLDDPMNIARSRKISSA
jgi:hypothetical protein